MARLSENSTASFTIVGLLGTSLVGVALWAGTLQAKTSELEGRVERQRTYILSRDSDQATTNQKLLDGIGEMKADMNGIKSTQNLMLQMMKKEFSH